MNALYGLDSRYDVVIIGARCAGATTALLLARAGAKVLVIDRQAYGSDTMSTHALMRGAVVCPSSDDLRLVRRFVKGGSGSSGLEFKRPATDAASVGWRWLHA